MPNQHRKQAPCSRLLQAEGDVRCRCGALMFKACGPVHLEMKCRRCGQLWQVGWL